MTLLKVYNRNGHCNQPEMQSYGLSDLMNNSSLGDYKAFDPFIGSPRANIKEHKESFSIEMEVPGIDKNLLRMDLSKDLLTISYQFEENHSDGKYSLREFDFRNFERTFRLHQSIEKEKITASFNNGILLVNLPKRDEAVDKGPRSIEIS